MAESEEKRMTGYENYDIRNIWIGAGMIAGLFVVFAVVTFCQRWKSRRRLMAKIRREWGQEPERSYDPTEFDAISHYYLNRETEAFQLDDITWNDLDMDRVFMQLNHTRSFLGESYLYYMLRTPQLHPEQLECFERLVTYFQGHPEEREELEYDYARIGRTGRTSIFDYIYNLAGVDAGSNVIHFAMWVLLAVSVGMLFVSPQAGVLLVIAALMLSMGSYEHFKRPIAPYVTSCAALERILSAAERLMKRDCPVIRERRERIKGAVGAFGKLRRNMTLLLLGDMEGGGIEGLLVSYLNSCLHLDLIQFKTVVHEVTKHMAEFERISDELGTIEAAIAVASFRKLHPQYAVPVLEEEGELRFHAEQMYHPLICEPVANTIDTDRCVLLTGSNASGKSTFLKTAALCAVLAQTIHTVPARAYKARYFRVFSSMALRDDLAAEESYYMVEIRSLKRILDQMSQEPPVLCCVDEVLRGTNTVERVAASSEILKSMAGQKLLCFAATHDIELTYLLEGSFRNCHFEEDVTDEEIRFDYLLKEGRAMTRNAIRLLKLMGYDAGIIAKAEQLAERLAVNNFLSKYE